MNADTCVVIRSLAKKDSNAASLSNKFYFPLPSVILGAYLVPSLVLPLPRGERLLLIAARTGSAAFTRTRARATPRHDFQLTPLFFFFLSPFSSVDFMDVFCALLRDGPLSFLVARYSEPEDG